MLVRVFLAVALAGVPAAQAQRAEPRGDSVARMHAFTACLAERREEEARAILSMDFRERAYTRRLQSLADRHHGCAADGTLQMGGPTFPGGLAEALLEADLGGTPLRERVAYDASRPAIEARDMPEGMGLCAVRTNPDAVGAVLATAPASAEESSALAALTPTLSGCVGQGGQIGLNRPGLRAMLALAAYRLHRHNSGPAQTASAAR